MSLSNGFDFDMGKFSAFKGGLSIKHLLFSFKGAYLSYIPTALITSK